jgi:hypothetical protein
MPKETSEEVAAIAAKYIDFDEDAFLDAEGTYGLDIICKDIRTLAASCLSQRSDADD